jgi:HK97 gp10 family phage protein
MAQSGVKVEGLREFNRALRKLPPEYKTEQKAIHKKVAEPVARAAEPRAPRKSGRLAASIRAQGTQREGRVAAGGASVPYAGPIHFGWSARNIEPQPFLTDALHAEEATVVDIYVEETDRLIDRVWAAVPKL